jgi:hypothetical protein
MRFYTIEAELRIRSWKFLVLYFLKIFLDDKFYNLMLNLSIRGTYRFINHNTVYNMGIQSKGSNYTACAYFTKQQIEGPSFKENQTFCLVCKSRTQTGFDTIGTEILMLGH